MPNRETAASYAKRLFAIERDQEGLGEMAHKCWQALEDEIPPRLRPAVNYHLERFGAISLLAIPEPCTVYHRSGLVSGEMFARREQQQITHLWSRVPGRSLQRYEPLGEVTAVHFPDGTTLVRHWDGTWFRFEQ